MTPYWILICALSWSALAFSDQGASEDITALPLEELMSVKVVTASKTEEKIQESPGITTVITESELKAFKAISLAEALDRSTSLLSLGTYLALNNIQSVRGDVPQSSFNPRILFLMDGRPVRDSVTGGALAGFLSGFPVDRVSRIEIVRGPGSVLYGTNAYTGVINIITKKGIQQNTSATFEYGSFNTRRLLLNSGQKWGDLTVAAGGLARVSQGWNFSLRDEKGIQDSIRRAELTAGGQLRLDYKGLSWNSFIGAGGGRSIGLTPIWTKPPEIYAETRHIVSDLSYRLDVLENWKASFFATYNQEYGRTMYDVDMAQDNITLQRSDDLLLETTHQISVSSQLDLTAGATLDLQTGKAQKNDLTPGLKPFNIFAGQNSDPFLVNPFYRRLLWGVYFQTEYKFIDGLKFIGGGQLNKTPDIKLDFVPRIGAIVSLESGWGSKILYGQAFRSATALEREIRSPGVVYGNDSLLPEKISTFEMQVSLRKKKYEAALTYFRSEQRNVIARSLPGEGITSLIRGESSPAGIPVYINRGEVSSQGIELEGQMRPILEVSVLGSLTYQLLENIQRVSVNTDSTVSNPFGMPLSMAKFGIIYRPVPNWMVAVFDSVFARFGSLGANPPEINPAVRPFHDLSFNIEYKYSNLTFNFFAKNALNEPIYFSEFIRQKINSFPGRPGAAVFGGVTLDL